MKVEILQFTQLTISLHLQGTILKTCLFYSFKVNVHW